MFCGSGVVFLRRTLYIIIWGLARKMVSVTYRIGKRNTPLIKEFERRKMVRIEKMRGVCQTVGAITLRLATGAWRSRLAHHPSLCVGRHVQEWRSAAEHQGAAIPA